jgi:hypothetical protein
MDDWIEQWIATQTAGSQVNAARNQDFFVSRLA